MTQEQVDKLISFGQMALEQGWYDKAREYFQQALELNPASFEAKKGLNQIERMLERRKAVAYARAEVKARTRPPLTRRVSSAINSRLRAWAIWLNDKRDRFRHKLVEMYSTLKNRLYKIRKPAIAVVVIIIVLIAVFMATQLYQENVYRERVQALGAEWLDAVDVASVTSRIALSGPVAELQRIRRELAAVEPPLRYKKAHEYMLTSMDYTLQGCYMFMSSSDPYSGQWYFEQAATYMDKATQELRNAGWFYFP